MYISISDTALNRVGHIENGIVHDSNGRVVGYIQGHGQIFRGTSPNGRLAYRLDTTSEDNVIYKTTPSSTRPGFFDIESYGFIKDMGMYYIYKRIAPGKGKLLGFADGGDIFSAGGAFLLL